MCGELVSCAEFRTILTPFKGPWSASAIFDDIEIIDKAW